jgi:hypothetical protein
MSRSHRLITVPLVALAVLAGLLTGCTPKSDPNTGGDAGAVAVSYLKASDQGDDEARCRLSTTGQGDKYDKCVSVDEPGPKVLTADPEVTEVTDWTDPRTGIRWTAVTTKQTASSSPNPIWTAVGLTNTDNRWLVDVITGIDGDPTVKGAGRQAVENENAG